MCCPQRPPRGSFGFLLFLLIEGPGIPLEDSSFFLVFFLEGEGPGFPLEEILPGHLFFLVGRGGSSFKIS